MKSRIQLSDHFTYGRLIRFVLPSIFMMIFTSIYGVVDGIFIARVVGETAFAAVNLVMPLIMALGSVGFMLGAGGSAIVAKTLGEGDVDKANAYFSFFAYVTLIAGFILAVLGEVFAERIIRLLGADNDKAYLIPTCLEYVRIALVGLPFFMSQNIFQTFFATAEKPNLGFIVTVIAGVMNMILDFLFVFVFGWGVQGAAAATLVSEVTGGSLPIIYFSRPNGTILRLGGTKFFGKALAKACGNGLSEFANNVSGSFVSMLYNAQLLLYVGENGVSAYGTLMYVNFIFIAIFIGYSIGTAQIVGYNYGAQNKQELKNVFKKSLVMMFSIGVVMFALAESLAPVFATIFANGNQNLESLTKRAFLFSGFIFLLCGFNIFSSAFFTALSNGVVSLIISLLRTLAFQATAVLLLPSVFGGLGWNPTDGIWFAGVFSDIMAFIVTWSFLIANRKKYGYI